MVSIALERRALGVNAEFDAGGFGVHLTEEGGVAAGTSASSSSSTRFVPLFGESRFSAFSVSPTFPRLRDVYPDPIRWPFIYGEQTGSSQIVRRLDLTTAAASSSTSSLGSGSNIVSVAAHWDSTYGYLLRADGEVRRWSVSLSNATTNPILAAGESGRDFEVIRLGLDGNFWLGGNGEGYIQKRDGGSAALIFEAQVPGATGTVDRYSNFAVPDSIDGAVVLNRFESGSGLLHHWHHVDGSGGVYDITADVTVDDVPWSTAMTSSFGEPGVNIGSYGGFISLDPEGVAGVGTDLLYGQVSVAAASSERWHVGYIGWSPWPIS